MASSKPYHHGDLKRALAEAAIALIAEVGPAAFTLREVARRAGISHNAPYRHFRDKDELLAAVAKEGFERLTAVLSAASGKTALRRLEGAGAAYVKFALEAPQHLQVMFDWPLDHASHPDLAEASRAAFTALVDLVASAQREKTLPGRDPMESAYIAWSLVHGVAKLAIAKQLPGGSETEILRFARRAIRALQKGMAIGNQGRKPCPRTLAGTP